MNAHILPAKPLSGPVELTNCDREAIHIPAGIQSCGFMIVTSIPDGKIISVSDNLTNWFAEADILRVGSHVGELNCEELKGVLAELTGRAEGSPLRLRLNSLAGHDFVLTGHRIEENIILEFESYSNELALSATDLIGQLFPGFDGKSLDEIYKSAVESIREFTGFDRVMLYKFHEDNHGSVIAEAKCEDQKPFLGLHYPAADIPVPARKLYELKWIRTIADSASDAIPMSPALIESGEEELKPINMSFSQLRAISPIHLEYLRNMGVAASMSISILNGGHLWGLIACHHRKPKRVSATVRDACELTGSLLSTYLTSRRQADLLEQQVKITNEISEKVSMMANEASFDESVKLAFPWIAELLNSDGVAWCHADDRTYWGETPSESETSKILDGLDRQNHEQIVYTDNMSEWLSTERSFANRLPGLLAMRMGKRNGGIFMFFRKPYETTIHWAGDPNDKEVDGAGRLTPRKSFHKFTESVSDRSVPWTRSDLDTAEILLSTLNSVIVEQSTRIQKLNEELRALNTDLDAFAYAASHDLKEPLRGINHHLFMMEQAETELSPAFSRGMGSMKLLVTRMSELLDGLLRFSRAGRQDLDWETFELSEVVSQAAEVSLGGIIPDNVDISCVEQGSFSGDFTCVREILTNLFSNAMKYNEQSRKTIRIGVIHVGKTPLQRNEQFGSNVIYVRDNGIGIEHEFQQKIFEIFTRLHSHQEYGGGSGAGLTIVRRMIERHNGKVSVESEPGEGTCFYFGWEAQG